MNVVTDYLKKLHESILIFFAFCCYYVKLELLGFLFFLTYINGLADKLVFKPNLFANHTSFFLFLETRKNFRYT